MGLLCPKKHASNAPAVPDLCVAFRLRQAFNYYVVFVKLEFSVLNDVAGFADLAEV